MSIYVLQRQSDDRRLCPALDDDGTDVFLAWPTLEQAQAGKRYQLDMGYIDKENGWIIVDAVTGVICEVERSSPILVAKNEA